MNRFDLFNKTDILAKIKYFKSVSRLSDFNCIETGISCGVEIQFQLKMRLNWTQHRLKTRLFLWLEISRMQNIYMDYYYNYTRYDL